MAKSLDINCSSREVLELQPLIMGKLAELQNCDVAKVDMDLVSYSLLLFENRNSVDAIVTELNLFFDGDNCPKFVQWLWRLLAPISEKQTRAKFTHKKEAKKESKVTEKAGVRDGDKVEENANEVNVTEGRGVVKKLAEAKVNELNMAKVELTKIESEITVLAKENTLLKRDDAKLDSFSYLKKLNFIFLAKKTDHKTTPCVKINVIKPPSEKKSLKSHISEVLNFTVAENKKLESGKMVVQSRSGRSQLLSRDDNLSSQLQRGGGSPPHKLATPSLIGKRKHRGESEAPRFAIVNKKSVDKTSCEKRGDQYAKGINFFLKI